MALSITDQRAKIFMIKDFWHPIQTSAMEQIYSVLLGYNVLRSNQRIIEHRSL